MDEKDIEQLIRTLVQDDKKVSFVSGEYLEIDVDVEEIIHILEKEKII